MIIQYTLTNFSDVGPPKSPIHDAWKNWRQKCKGMANTITHLTEEYNIRTSLHNTHDGITRSFEGEAEDIMRFIMEMC